MQNRLRLTARVAVSVSLLSALILLSALFFLLKGQPEESYFHIIQSLTRSQDQLAMAMLIGAMLILLVAGLITWAITLYSSHRVAGPLYRFARNLELEIMQGPVATIGLRKNDSFQELSEKLSRAATGLTHYYGDQVKLVDELARSLDAAQGMSAEKYSELLQKLKASITGES